MKKNAPLLDKKLISKENIWYVYIVSCEDLSLYTGITTDPERRLQEHNSDKNGARYTRGRRPVRLAYLECFPSRSAASRREHLIKRMPIAEKRQLLIDHPSQRILSVIRS
jgi:putative endonuclease